MLDKLQAIREKYLHLEEQLSDPGIVADMDKSKRVNKEYRKLQPIIEAYTKYEKVLHNLSSAEAVLRSESDPEMRDLAREEMAELEPLRDSLEEEIKVLLTPKDPEDEKDVIFEIRSGTGGDEAALFAGDLYRMYGRYFSEQGWEVEVLDENNQLIGQFQQKLLSFGGKFEVLDAAGNSVCWLKGKWTSWDFRFEQDGRELARVSKEWAGLGKEFFTSADNHMLIINDSVAPNDKVRQLILAAVMCIDMVLKE